MIRREVFAGMFDQFTVRRMVDSLDSDDLRPQCWDVFLDMFDEFGFRSGRSRYQDCARITDGIRHAREEFVVLSRVTAAYGVRLVVNMANRIVRMQYSAIDLRNIEMEYAGFAVINPNDRVIVARHGRLLLHLCPNWLLH